MDSSFFTWSEGDSVAVTMSEQATVTAQVSFADQPESCSLYVTPHLQAQNLAVRALVQMAPWLLLTLLVFSLLCAFGYSRYITRPIVRLSGIAGRMVQLARCFSRITFTRYSPNPLPPVLRLREPSAR